MENKKNIGLLPEDMKLIMDNSYDEIFVVDKDCRIIYVNGGCTRNYGPLPKDILGKTVYEMVDNGFYSPPLAPIVMQRKEIVTMEQMT
ncbi:MAG: PAS domain-containing protein, partial [Clostridiales bacterium]